MRHHENDGQNRRGWKMQDHIDFKLIRKFELQLHRTKLNKYVFYV